MLRIAVVTGQRADYGLLYWLLKEMESDGDLQSVLIATGMHLSPEAGLTVKEIERDGFEVYEKVEMLLSSDTPAAIAKSIGLGVIGFSQTFARTKPDLLVLLGDRFEMLAAAIAAMPFTIPIAHIGGGEKSEGTIDEGIRHALTKMSHLHFVIDDISANRIKKMGEQSWRIFVAGSLRLDFLNHLAEIRLDKKKLSEKLGVDFSQEVILAIYHPVTLEFEDTERQVGNLIEALRSIDRPTVIIYPNLDTSGRVIIDAIERFTQNNRKVKLFRNLSRELYLSLLSAVAVLVGNSSSAIIEAPSFKLPAVNIGNRQKGRVRTRNVIDVGYEVEDIVAGIREALYDKEFRKELEGLKNPFGDGFAAARIVKTLKGIQIDQNLIEKEMTF